MSDASAAVIVEHDVTVLQGDAREQLATLPDGLVQCVVTSPPYYGLRDYGVDGQLGLEPSPAEYVKTMRGVFAEVQRVLADDGVLWLNLGDSYSFGKTPLHNTNAPNKNRDGSADHTNETIGSALGYSRQQNSGLPAKNMLGIPWRVAFALQDDGWTLRNAVIWHKPNAMPESVTDRLSARYEHVFLFSKWRRYQFDLGSIREPVTGYQSQRALSFGRDTKEADVPGQTMRQHRAERATVAADGKRNPGDVWTIPTAPFPGGHFACMPPALARRCILAGCPEDGTVLDPFAGSGTTLMVARQLGRKSVGIELSPEYIDIIRDRIGDTPLDFGASA